MLTIYHDGFLQGYEQCLKKIENEMIIRPIASNHF